jgi:hypothetical protein
MDEAVKTWYDDSSAGCAAQPKETFNPLKRGARQLGFASKPDLQTITALLLMTVLYAARVARFDLFKPIDLFAKRITKWDSKCDARLHQLMSYVHHTADHVMLGFIGEDNSPAKLELHPYCDVDLAGDPYTLKSTSDFRSAPASKDRRQELTLHLRLKFGPSIAACALEVIHALSWHRIMKQYHMADDAWDVFVHLHEDNTTCIVCARTGNNPTMKTLERCVGVSVWWIYQRVTSRDYNLIHTNTKHMCADF